MPSTADEIARIQCELEDVRAAMARTLKGGQSATNTDAGTAIARVPYEVLVTREAALVKQLRTLRGAGGIRLGRPFLR